jgi:site-specific recombinase XerC
VLHRFASRAYRGTRSQRGVQVLLAHASIATTERYTCDRKCFDKSKYF